MSPQARTTAVILAAIGGEMAEQELGNDLLIKMGKEDINAEKNSGESEDFGR